MPSLPLMQVELRFSRVYSDPADHGKEQTHGALRLHSPADPSGAFLNH